MPRYIVQAHIPHGSGDAEYQIVDADNTVIAIVDPAAIVQDASVLADEITNALNAHDSFLDLVRTVAGLDLYALAHMTRDAMQLTLDEYRSQAQVALAAFEKEVQI